MNLQPETPYLSEIHIAVGFDRNYYNPFCALAESIKRNHKGVNVIIHAIASGLDYVLKEKISAYLSPAIKINFYEINEELAGRFVLNGKWTMAVYFRLFFPLLLKDKVAKFIYLDTDIIICNCLLPLFNTDTGNFPVAAVYDNYVKYQPLIGLPEEGKYFNSGMLLIDVKRWNDQQISEKTFDYLLNHPENIRFVDQCALNAVLKDNWHSLPVKYNFLYTYLPSEINQKDLNLLKADLAIIHFTLTRPWEMLCKNRLRDLYYINLRSSEIRDGKNLYTDYNPRKIVKFLKIRLVEYYFDSGILKRIYRKLKKLSVIN